MEMKYIFKNINKNSITGVKVVGNVFEKNEIKVWIQTSVQVAYFKKYLSWETRFMCNSQPEMEKHMSVGAMLV